MSYQQGSNESSMDSPPIYILTYLNLNLKDKIALTTSYELSLLDCFLNEPTFLNTRISNLLRKCISVFCFIFGNIFSEIKNFIRKSRYPDRFGVVCKIIGN